jgi:adenosine deaminase
MEEHPLRKLMERGVRTTINSDDPGVMNIDLMDEYIIAHEILGMTLEQLIQCNQWAVESSFICEKKKAAVWPSKI